MSQFANLTRCGCHTTPWWLSRQVMTTVKQFSINIKKHLTNEFSGMPGTRNNDWSQATGYTKVK